MAERICRSLEILGLEDASEKERAGENSENAHAPETQRNVHVGKMKELVQAEMDPDLWGNLDKDVLEMIIHRLPLKNIVRSQILSRTWRSKFLSRDFQKEVKRFSSSWGPSISYHPLCLSEKGLSGYDCSSLRWKYLCSLPDFPSDSIDELEELGAFPEVSIGELEELEACKCPENGRLLFRQTSSWQLRASNCYVFGCLIFSIFFTTPSRTNCRFFDNSMFHIMVTNAITKTVRRLPSFLAKSQFCFKLRPDCYFLVSDDVYQIVMFDEISDYGSEGILCATVYHSGLNSWTENQSGSEMMSGCRQIQPRGVTLRGIIYLPLDTISEDAYRYLRILVTYDVRKGVFEKIVLPAPFRHGRLVVWRDHLMIVTVVDNIYPVRNHGQPVHVAIFKLNLDTLQPTLVSAAPILRPEDISSWEFGRNLNWSLPPSLVIADTECIYMYLDRFYPGKEEWDKVIYQVSFFLPDILKIPIILPCWSEEDEHGNVSNIHPDIAEMTRTGSQIPYGKGLKDRWLVFNVNHNTWNCFSVSHCKPAHPESECIDIPKSGLGGQVFQPGLNPFVLA